MQSAQGPVRKRASVCWNQMHQDTLTLEMWWGNACKSSIRKDCPERRDDGLRLYFKQPVIAGVIALYENDKHPVGAGLWSGWASAVLVFEELQEGTSLWVLRETCFIRFTPSHHRNALTAGFEILKEAGFCLCSSSAWSLTTPLAVPASPVWSRRQCVRMLCVLCRHASMRFPQRKSSFFLLNWETEG